MILLEENEWVDESQNISLLYLLERSWKNHKTALLKETNEPIQFSARTFLKILRRICPEDPISSIWQRKPEIVLSVHSILLIARNSIGSHGC